MSSDSVGFLPTKKPPETVAWEGIRAVHSIEANGHVSMVHWPHSSLHPTSLFRSREVLDKPAVKSDANVGG